MDVSLKNRAFSSDNWNDSALWPNLQELKQKPLQFDYEFGLTNLPEEPGLITIRGPRQYGKSTWLENQMWTSLEKFGPGSTFFLNGDELMSGENLENSLLDLALLFSTKAKCKRLFIDEITAIADWQKTIKKILDRGILRDTLIVTTGSRATDMRRGLERLPGRKGKLAKTDYIFLPFSYRQFSTLTKHKWHDLTWIAYLLTGGSPIAANEIYQHDRLPEYFIQLTRDWVLGEIVASGRTRLALANILQTLYTWGGSPVGFAKLAREAGLANNTVAAGYMEILSDLMCVLPSWPADTNTLLPVLRKPAKFHFINMACAIAFSPQNLRSIRDWQNLAPEEQAKYLEWLIAQDLWRRAVLSNANNPEHLLFWQTKEHEIDFVTEDKKFYEVKRGKSNPYDFLWFAKTMPKNHLTVINQADFESSTITGKSISQFLESPN